MHSIAGNRQSMLMISIWDFWNLLMLSNLSFNLSFAIYNYTTVLTQEIGLLPWGHKELPALGHRQSHTCSHGIGFWSPRLLSWRVSQNKGSSHRPQTVSYRHTHTQSKSNLQNKLLNSDSYSIYKIVFNCWF